MVAEQWDGSAMPSQHGKVAVVTGANQGIGFVAARRLAERGAHVILACRNAERGRKAVNDIREHLLQLEDQESVGQVNLLLVDIGCLESVKSFAAALHNMVDQVDILINNAGVGVPIETESTDGYPIQFGVNYLGHFYLTTLVFDLLKASKAARIVNVSSVAHRQQFSRMTCRSTKLDFANLHKGEGDNGWARYEKSKLCNLIFTFELARRLKTAGIHNVKSIGAHPGVCHTNIFDQAAKAMNPEFMLGIISTFYSYALQSAEMGGLPIVYAATVENVDTAEYVGPDGHENWFGYPQKETPAATSQSEEYGQELWELSERLTKTPFHV